MTCTKCQSPLTIKYGLVKRKQRYYCKPCDYTFIIVDGREQEIKNFKKNLRKLYNRFKQFSYQMSVKMFHFGRSIAKDWIKTEAANFKIHMLVKYFKHTRFHRIWEFCNGKHTSSKFKKEP